jgi:hypothetical protein
MAKLIVVLILVSGGGAAVIPGWNSIGACNAAKNGVEGFFKEKHGVTSYVEVDTKCLEFPNNPQ